MLKPEIKSFFDPGTWTFTYVVYEKPSAPCVVIDSVMNYDPKSGRTSTTSADEVIAFIRKIICNWNGSLKAMPMPTI